MLQTMDRLSRNSPHCPGNQGARRATPGRQDDRRQPRTTPHPGTHPGPARPAAPIQPTGKPMHAAATDLLCGLLGPIRWLGAAKGSDLSEAWGGKPGDAGWLLDLPGGGRLAITVSRRLGFSREDARVILFQELRGYGGLTWCLPADSPQHLDRIRTEVEALLADGATVSQRGETP